MKVTVVSVGSRGDVEPYLALALGLRAAGHEVSVATHEQFRSLTEVRGLAFKPLSGNPRAAVESADGQEWLASGQNPFAFLRLFRRLVLDSFEEAAASIESACEDADAVIYSALGWLAWNVAEQRGIPSAAAFLQPASPTRAFPPATAPPPRPLPGWANLALHHASGQAVWQIYRRPVNAWRRRLGLEPLPLSGPYGRLARQRSPLLYGYSPSVLARPADWPAWIHVTGYWFLGRDGEWQPPADVEDFMAAGAPPVCVSFGSMRPRDPERFGRLVVEAVRRAGVRAIVQAGWADLSVPAGSDQLLAAGELPHGWLFERGAAVVHHGGAGTTAAAIRAGRPAVVVPFFADQPFWAERVRRLGVGPPPLPQAELSVDALAARLRAAVEDEAMRSRAAALGERVRAERGVEAAVAAWEAHHLAG